ncbi:MAG: hypothetical protein ABIG95_01435 [Candidatus Woesearchaeota archaeon]
MQGPLHLIMGILIQRNIAFGNPIIRYGTIAALAILSHLILDFFCKLSYHSPKPLINDKYWLFYNSAYALLCIPIIFFYRQYLFAMFFAMLPDFEWITAKRGGKLRIHKFVNGMRASVPDLRRVRLASLSEIFLTLILLMRL